MTDDLQLEFQREMVVVLTTIRDSAQRLIDLIQGDDTPNRPRRTWKPSSKRTRR